jgi:PAS domain S-box-containing protein
MARKPTYEELEQQVKAIESQVAHLISDREKLISTQTRLQSLINACPAVIYTCKPTDDYKVTYISQNIKEQLGYQPQDFTEDPIFWMNNIHPEDRTQVRADLSKILPQPTKRDHYSHEYRFRDKGGNYQWMHDEFKITYNEEGKPLKIVGSWIDISKRKFVEEKLRESEEKARALLNATTDGALLLDRNAILLDANETFIQRFDKSKDEILGLYVGDLFPSKVREYRKIKFDEVVTSGNPVTLIDEREGMWNYTKIYPICDASGDVTRVAVFAHDITQQKLTETALRKSKAKYQDLYDNAPDMFVSVDAKTAEIIECNQTVVDQTGFTKNEIIGRLIFDMYTPESAAYAKKYIFPSFATTGVIKGEELRLQRKNGSPLDVSLNSSAVRDEKGNLLYSRSIWRNISTQKENEKKLSTQKNRLQKQAWRLVELNSALKILIERREEEKKQLKESILNNVKKTILPYIAKMEKSKLKADAAVYLEIIKSNLADLVSPLVQRLSINYIGLTQKEIEIAGLIKIGKTSKEIAEVLNVSLNTVSVHRYKIRKKLNLLNKNVNLESYVQSLGEESKADQ